MTDHKWKKVSEEVYYAPEKLVAVTQENVSFLKKVAQANKRRRSRLCAHNDTGDLTQEMIIVLGKGNYVRPHKHLDKSESFHVIEGSAKLIFFDEKGNFTHAVSLGDHSSGKVFFNRIADASYHSLMVTSDFFVFHETTKGPFIQGNRTDTVFASWAPQDNDEAAAQAFMDKLKEKI
ncbi:MAG: cupin fold metalloprotein, WbuC family [Candidatus Omnitrophica bacterium]|nr:cupin fold metalloprotein, WbuC family [Candidatus Omnitrophota bacterium]